MGTVTFQAYFDDTLVGRESFCFSTILHNLRGYGSLALTAMDLVLPPEGQVTTHLTGRMIPQSGNGLNVIGRLFSEYLAADNITLSVTGESVQPTGTSSPVTWLSDAFKTLTLAVTLPGQKFNVSAPVKAKVPRFIPRIDHSIHCIDGPQPDNGNSTRGICSIVGFEQHCSGVQESLRFLAAGH